MTLFEEHVNPHLGNLLSKLRMDKEFIRGEGLSLYDIDGEKYLDFIAAYGALPFGYNDPDIWQAVMDVKHTMEPSFTQPSSLGAAGELAAALLNVMPAGMETVTFTNSGAETVEAAIKLARSFTGKHGILSAAGSFHGKTLGALSATGNSYYQEGFGAPAPGFSTVPYGDLDALSGALLAGKGELAAFIVEPIQGEGGIIVPPEGYLRAAHDMCVDHNVLFIADEIQTGLGRTGEILAGDYVHYSPDIILLAKALGGGLYPIGACVAKEGVYTESFGLKHSSTFAGNTPACRVGIASVAKIREESLLANVRERGRQLKNGLEEIRNRFPAGIREVRGKGLLIGIELEGDPAKFPQGVLSVLADLSMLSTVVASHLLNKGRVRVAPTLNRSNTVRIEPPLIVTPEQCEYALEAIEATAKLVDRGNAAAFLAPFIDVDDPKVALAENRGAAHRSDRKPVQGEGRFAFIMHPLDDNNWSDFDPSFEAFPREELGKLSDFVASVVDPFVVSDARVVSKTGSVASGQFICIPRTTKQLLTSDESECTTLVSEAVDLARENGARIVGLGAYTSVVTRGGRNIHDPGVALTTGNCFTVATAVDAVMKTLEYRGKDPGSTTACVIGATGSVGRAVSILLAEKVGRLILVGNPTTPESAKRRMLEVTSELCSHLAGNNGRKGPGLSERANMLAGYPGFPKAARTREDFSEFARMLTDSGGFVSITTDLESVIGSADVIVTATSSTSQFVHPEKLKHGAIVCDVSVPSNVAKDEISKREDLLVIDGGVVTLPGNPDLGWDFGLGPREVFACVAETIMLALDHRYDNVGLGIDLPLNMIMHMRNAAETHGLSFAGVRSMGRSIAVEPAATP